MREKDLKKILDDHKVDHKDMHRKEEFVDLILQEDTKKRGMEEQPRSNLGHHEMEDRNK